MNKWKNSFLKSFKAMQIQTNSKISSLKKIKKLL